MRTLIVGGTGLAGGVTARLMREQGHDVTLMARNAPSSQALADFDVLPGSYIEGDWADGRLEGFEALVFAAAADIRNLPQDGSESPESFYSRVNDEAVPRFFEAARVAGIRRCAYLGTFYPQVAPHRIEVCPYVHSRHVTDEAVRSLSGADFNVCSINAPFIIGHLPGLKISHLGALLQYCRGQLEGLPLFAPVGGTNHMTAPSVAEAIIGGLERGESAKAYLVGDENYSWKDYLESWCRAAGHPRDLEVREDDHPMLPNAIMFAGPGATVSYEPDPAETRLLAYGRGRVGAMIEEVVQAFSA